MSDLGVAQGSTLPTLPERQPSVAALTGAANAGTGLDPNVITAAATGGTVQSAIKNTQATISYSAAKQITDLLNSQPNSVRLVFWNQANDLERGMLNTVGFRDPSQPDPSGGGGFWGDLWNTIKGVPSAAVHDVGSVINDIRQVPNEALSAAAKPLAAINHTIRALDYTMSGGEPGGSVISSSNNLGELKWLADPGQWARAWDATENGATSFSPTVVRQLSKTMTPLQLSVAKDLASGMQQQDVLAQYAPHGAAPVTAGNSTATPVQNQIMAMFQDKDFMAQVQTLQNAHLDFGRFVTGADQGNIGQLPAGPAPQNVDIPRVNLPLLGNVGGLHVATTALASGMVDAGVDWFDDPLIIGGKAMEARKIARFVFSTADDVRSIYASEPAVQRLINGLADAVQKGGSAGVRAFDTKFSSIADDLQRARATTPDKVLDYFASEAGRDAIMEGRAGRYYHDVQLWPTLSPVGAYLRRLKVAAADNLGKWADSNVVASADDSPTDILDKLGLDPNGNPLTPGTAQFALDTPGPLSHGARLINRLVTMAPRNQYLDPMAKDSGAVINQWARMFLPGWRADQLQRMWADAVTEGEKRMIYKGMLEEGFHAAGVYRTEEGREGAQRFLAQFEDGVNTQRYAPGKIDLMAGPEGDGVGSSPEAIGSTQLSHRWSLPDFRQMYRWSKKAYAMQAVNAGANADAVDKVMSSFWKPMMLLRFGFALRVGGEEAAGFILRNGLPTYLRSLHMKRVLHALEDTTLEDAAERNVAVRLFHSMTSHIPIEAVRNIKTPEEFLASVYGWRVIDWLRLAGYKAFTPEDVLASARAAVDHDILSGASWKEISSYEHGASGGDASAAREIYQTIRNGARPLRYEVKGPIKEFARPTTPDDLLEHAARYHYSLTGIAREPEARGALENYGDEAAQKEAVYQYLSDPEHEDLVGRFVRSKKLRDGRIVGQDATQEEAWRDHADVITQRVNAYLRAGGKDVRLIPHVPESMDIRSSEFVRQFRAAEAGDNHYGTRLIDYMREHNWQPPEVPELAKIPPSTLPPSIISREMGQISENWFSRMVRYGMQDVVGKPVDAISRRPMFLWFYHVAYQDNLTRLLDSGMARAAAEKLASDVAQERAMREILPFIHDPEWRSQFSVITRNLFPFWFAQEQQAKRWARTLQIAPESIRKVQLLMNSLRTSGFIHRDPGSNEDYFYYPMAGMAMQALQDIPFLGSIIRVPVPTGMTGQVSLLVPGLKSFGVPSVGPLVALPLMIANYLIPGAIPSLKLKDFMQRVTGSIIGSAGTNEPMWAQMTPTLFSRLYVAFANNDTNSPMILNAMVQAASYLEANNIGVPEIGKNGVTASNYSEELQMYQNRLSKWAHTFAMLRAFLGFGMPASPELAAGDMKLTNELSDLMNRVPYDEALAIFMKMHPDAGAYDVFESSSQSGAFVPATDSAMHFIEQNFGTFKQYPLAAPWLFPTATEKGPFSDQAYRLQLALDLRQRRFMFQDQRGNQPYQYTTSWFNEVEFQRVASQYYRVKDAIAAAEKADPGNKQAYQNWWDNWSNGVRQTNPIFAAEDLSGNAANRRAAVVAQMQLLLGDPNTPDTQQTRDLGALMDQFTQIQQYDAQTQAIDAYRPERTALKQQFTAWATEFAKTHPDVATFWSSVLSYQVPG